jgi:peptidoglycan hydrolase CwlO-like protein
MELKDAIQKIKELLSEKEPEVVVEEVVEVPEVVVEETIEEPVEDKFETLKAALVNDFTEKLEALKADFEGKLLQIEEKNKAGHAKIAEIISQVAETPIEEPSEKPKTLLSEAAQTKAERIAKTAEAMKQYREQNKK